MTDHPPTGQDVPEDYGGLEISHMRYANHQAERWPNLNDLIADLTSRGLAVRFWVNGPGISCRVADRDPEDDAYFGHGIGLSPQLALKAALEDGGPW